MEHVVPFDFGRMLLGEDPPLFYLEIVVRTLVVYVYALALIRWVGGRSVGQLSLIEFLLVIALGSAVGDALFYPEVPILHALLVVTLVVFINKGLDLLVVRSERAQRLINGDPVAVVEDGRILHDGIATRDIGAGELMAALRVEGVETLGEVRAAYLEQNGRISLFRADPPRPGLRIVPPPELDPLPRLHHIGADPVCCIACGALDRPPAPDAPCSRCGGTGWTPAVPPPPA